MGPKIDYDAIARRGCTFTQAYYDSPAIIKIHILKGLMLDKEMCIKVFGTPYPEGYEVLTGQAIPSDWKKEQVQAKVTESKMSEKGRKLRNSRKKSNICDENDVPYPQTELQKPVQDVCGPNKIVPNNLSEDVDALEYQKSDIHLNSSNQMMPNNLSEDVNDLEYQKADIHLNASNQMVPNKVSEDVNDQEYQKPDIHLKASNQQVQTKAKRGKKGRKMRNSRKESNVWDESDVLCPQTELQKPAEDGCGPNKMVSNNLSDVNDLEYQKPDAHLNASNQQVQTNAKRDKKGRKMRNSRKKSNVWDESDVPCPQTELQKPAEDGCGPNKIVPNNLSEDVDALEYQKSDIHLNASNQIVPNKVSEDVNDLEYQKSDIHLNASNQIVPNKVSEDVNDQEYQKPDIHLNASKQPVQTKVKRDKKGGKMRNSRKKPNVWNENDVSCPQTEVQKPVENACGPNKIVPNNLTEDVDALEYQKVDTQLNTTEITDRSHLNKGANEKVPSKRLMSFMKRLTFNFSKIHDHISDKYSSTNDEESEVEAKKKKTVPSRKYKI
ncbi:uncharacterized protein [Atheta coriaria]|uniref:uncharacterized protein n=1 Tax=Dalotia coriaria TaxID=877792 RepID=UPI0031F36D1F